MKIELKKGETIIRQGDKDSRYLYIIIEGEAIVSKTIDNIEIQCGKLKKNDILGEISMILNTERAATIKASSEILTLKQLDKAAFLKEIKKQPEIAWILLEKLANKTAKFDSLRDQYIQITR